MAFDLVYTLRAEADLDDILSWLLAKGAGKAGLRWFTGLRKAVGRLALTPPQNRLIP